MTKTLNLQRSLFLIAVPLFIMAIMVGISQSSFLRSNSNPLSIGITFDLLLTAPLIYFLLIRRTNIPKFTVLPFLILGMVVGSFIIPVEYQYYLNLFRVWVFPIIELAVLSYVIFNVIHAIKKYRVHKTAASFDFFTTLKKTCYEILPRVAVIPVITEIAVFYYSFIFWRKRKLKKGEFSYHKNSGTISVLIAILLIVAIETVVLHILLAKWSAVTAWIMSFLSIYSGIQIFGFLKSMLKRPIAIADDQLFLRYGIMAETTIALRDIAAIEISSKELILDKETRKLSIFGELETHNVIIRLKKENELIALYGIKRTYKNLAFYVDDKIEFKGIIDKATHR
ncbi:hypothetical protein [Maribacter sp. R77961]|uniref:hypothetical protein n=1 Tax=Maribacter sp. R77961 TaxID=3093871 RepID=UPI0037CB0F79